MRTGRAALLAASADLTVSVPFAARPVPQPANDTTKWAFDQFKDLQRVLYAQQKLIVELQDEVASLKGLVGDGSWDG